MKGQAKKDFEKWLKEPILEHGRFGQLVTNTFDTMPFSMQYGIIVDWFDSVGIEILISKDYDYENNIDINAYIFHIDNHESNDFKSYPTRTQARQKAIEKANEIYNNKNK